MEIVLIGFAFFKFDESIRLPKTNGIAAYISELLNFTLSQNISVKFVGKIYNYTPQKNLEYIECFKNETGTFNVLLSLVKQSTLIKLKKKSIIHANRPDHLFAFTLFKKNHSILTIHGQQAITIERRKGKIVRLVYSFMEKIALKKARYIIVTDNITREFYCKFNPHIEKKIIQLPTGVNLKKFKPMSKERVRKKHNLSASSKICLYIGRIETPKRVGDIIDSFTIFREKIPSGRLLIVGEGKDRMDLEKKVDRLGLEKDILFWGNCSRDEIPEILNCGDILVLYSYNEGSPAIIKESLACGVPVVANSVGDIPEVVVDGKTGYIVRNENNDELARLMILCLEESQKMGGYCIEKAKEYSSEILGKKILKIYRKCSREQL